jgi:hypothetical protein
MEKAHSGRRGDPDSLAAGSDKKVGGLDGDVDL